MKVGGIRGRERVEGSKEEERRTEVKWREFEKCRRKICKGRQKGSVSLMRGCSCTCVRVHLRIRKRSRGRKRKSM